MASARAGLGLNEKNIDIAQAGHWPSVSLSAAYNRASRRPDRVYANPLDNYTASIRLALRFNIYNGGRIQANVDEARLRLTKAQADHDNLARIVENDVLLRTRNLDLLHEVFELQVVRAKAAEQTAAAAKALYKEGKRSALEVRNAELSLTRARLAVSNARLDIEVAREELRRAIGRPPIDIDALPSGGR